jgi:hypothetical protein
MPEARINRAANAAAELPHAINRSRALQEGASHRLRLPACHLTQPGTASTRPSVNMMGSSHAMIYGHFRPRRHLMTAIEYRNARAKAFRIWRQETCAQIAA